MNKEILIIEDDEKIQKLITLTLSDFRNKKNIFENGLAACKYIEENNKKIGLIFLDIGLEGINGFEVLKKIRRKFNLKIPVIISSAYVSKEDIKKGITLGANYYLTKPFNLKQLIEVCKEYLGG
jgi:DNA-binding response OmpR family regulator